MVRLARAEKNLELLLASRPVDRPALLAWQGSAALTRAALANEANQPEQFRQHYGRALDLFAEAISLGPDSDAVFAITGGSQAELADRLPAAERAAGWELAYHAYQQLWRLQGPAIKQLPVHHKGEVLSGLTQSAQRTGRDDEVAAQLDRILALLQDTPYANRARQWKDDPSARTETKLMCRTCHAPGTLITLLEAISQ